MYTIETYEMNLKSLMKLSPEVLSAALLKLAEESQQARLMVERLISTPVENIERFKEHLEEITCPPRGSRQLSGPAILNILTDMLDCLDVDTIPPEIGLELTEAFFSTDQAAFESCTTLDFEFALLFDRAAEEVFPGFARQISDTDLVVQTLRRLMAEDNYGARGGLLTEAPTYLHPLDVDRLMVKNQR